MGTPAPFPPPSSREAFALLGQVGLVIAICVGGGVYAGAWLDHQFGGGGVLVAAGVAAGLAAAGLAVWGLLRRFWRT